MSELPSKKIESFSLTIRTMSPQDIRRLHQLSVAAGWMHRFEDWEFALQIGEGIYAADEIGRILGSAMFYPITPDFGALGMVIIAPRMFETGTNDWLVDQMLQRSEGRNVVVCATPDAYPIYVAHGFRAGSTVFQIQGVVADCPNVVPQGNALVRVMRPDETDRIRALDAAAYPVSRAGILDVVLSAGSVAVIETDGEVTGYALCRAFGRGKAIGPIVAITEADAVALVAHHVKENVGNFVRVDTACLDGPLQDHLFSCGLKHESSVIAMARGTAHDLAGPQKIFGLLNQAIG